MPDAIRNLLNRLGIDYRLAQHEPVFTVAESSKVLTEKTPVKNLLLQEEEGDRLVLVIMNGQARLDTKNLAQGLGVKRLVFAKPEVLKATLGVTPGSVSLFGLLHPNSGVVEVVVDRWLLDKPDVGFHPNDNRATIFIPGAAIEPLLVHMGRHYLVLELS